MFNPDAMPYPANFIEVIPARRLEMRTLEPHGCGVEPGGEIYFSPATRLVRSRTRREYIPVGSGAASLRHTVCSRTGLVA